MVEAAGISAELRGQAQVGGADLRLESSSGLGSGREQKDKRNWDMGKDVVERIDHFFPGLSFCEEPEVCII